MDILVSHFDSVSGKPSDIAFSEAIAAIKTGKYAHAITSLRAIDRTVHGEQADAIKKHLPAFTYSGRYAGKRTLDSLVDYIPVVGIDIDHIGIEEAQNLFKQTATDPHAFLSFISPSGDGLKVFYRHDGGRNEHIAAFKQITERFRQLYGVEPDEKTKDIGRLCFYSADPGLYLNESAPLIPVQAAVESSPSLPANSAIDNDNIFTHCLSWTENYLTYTKGSRNNFVFQLACSCNRYGIEMPETLDFCLTNFDLNPERTIGSIKSAYDNNQKEFGKYKVAKFTKSAKQTEKDKPDQNPGNLKTYKSLLLNTPTFPKELYEQLPNLLKDTCKYFPDDRQRDIYLLSALGVSGYFADSVFGYYSDDRLSPNLFCFIIAPSGVGKRAIQYAKKLAEKAQRLLDDHFESELKRFELEMIDYNEMVKGKNAKITAPNKPQRTTVFVAADNSQANLINQFKRNGERGIMFESEADVLTSAQKQEWGNYSSFLRSIFGHEGYTLARKSEDLNIHILNGWLSVVVSGTPNQAFRFLPNSEDGLFSRFLYYLFDKEAIWSSPAPSLSEGDLGSIFYSKGDELIAMANHFKENSTEMLFTDEDWNKWDAFFADALEDFIAITDVHAKGIVFRAGMSAFKIALTLTALRTFETKPKTNKVYCHPDDLDSALKIIDVSMQHAQIIYSNLPNKDVHAQFKVSANCAALLNALPEQFQRKEAIEIGKKLNIKERTTDKHLKSMKGAHIEEAPELGYGWYKKLESLS